MPAAIVTHADAGAGPAIVARLEADGFTVHAIDGLVAARSDVGRRIAEVAAAGTDLLVNNYPSVPSGLVVETPTDRFSTALDHGLNSVFSACREAAAVAVARDAPLTIVNVVSALDSVGLAGRAAEACAAAGVLAATKALAAEWGPHRIRVSAIVVGPTIGWGDGVTDVPGLVPLGRLVDHADVAAAVAYVAGAGAIAGHGVTIDGGWLAYGYREDS